MHQTFTGASRRPRQVNLSGRNKNPFAVPGAQTSSPSGAQNTLANAQHERFLRQQERDRQRNTLLLQKTWRGHSTRRKTRDLWRQEWDASEQHRYKSEVVFEGEMLAPSLHALPYTHDDWQHQLQLLVAFLSVRSRSDLARLKLFVDSSLVSFRDGSLEYLGPEDGFRLLRLGASICDALSHISVRSISPQTCCSFLEMLSVLCEKIPQQLGRRGKQYYQAIAAVIVYSGHDATTLMVCGDHLRTSMIALLKPITPETVTAYEGFALECLTVSDLPRILPKFNSVADEINFRLLARSLLANNASLQSSNAEYSIPPTQRMWLLAYLIYFYRQVHSFGSTSRSFLDAETTTVISSLLSSLGPEIASRIDLEDVEAEEIDLSTDASQKLSPLPAFVREQITSLVNQQSVSGLLSQSRLTTDGLEAEDKEGQANAKVLANYALTLLRIFSKRADEIRMWLYLGGSVSPGGPKDEGSLSAIRYFWKATKSSEVFRKISSDSRAVLSVLQAKPTAQSPFNTDGKRNAEERGAEWRVILLFLELYTFVLKVMDDEEFLSGGRKTDSSTESSHSWTRESAIPLDDVKALTVFLKNLAFTIYWNASELTQVTEGKEGGSLREYFGRTVNARSYDADSSTVRKTTEVEITGNSGITVEYTKGMVTGLLRMLYERDSRRPFLPQGHWLMTSRFDMEGFIPAVVAEEENRHVLEQEQEEEDDAWEDLDNDRRNSMIIGNRHSHRVMETQNTERRQKKAMRRKYLEAVAPRLEILQNTPFFIPFATRVQIFREFVHLDQHRRRGGYVDPDSWRMSIMGHPSRGGRPSGHDEIGRHHAKIRRGQVFEDAYDQFYELADGLKEPIQITFVDQFDTVEAGIDGGGVTKEFLTSVTNEALSPTNPQQLFVENEQNLLYPNPVAVEQRKDFLRRAGLRQGSSEWNEHVRDLLRRYEFLGRVIGKCLYEGILVDISFAGFFLLKWALTGGVGSASKESSYRASINDLRDLDEGLYQGLVSRPLLKLIRTPH